MVKKSPFEISQSNIYTLRQQKIRVQNGKFTHCLKIKPNSAKFAHFYDSRCPDNETLHSFENFTKP